MNQQSLILPQEQNPLQKAFDDYHRMEMDLADTKASNTELKAANMALIREVDMLREVLRTADADRLRLNAVSATLLGRLLAINDCIAGAVKASVRDGIEADRTAASQPGAEAPPKPPVISEDMAEAAEPIREPVQPPKPQVPDPMTPEMQRAVGLPPVDLRPS